jgi:hypothetical protein
MKILSHRESHIVELDDGSKWKIFPGDLDLTLTWRPETILSIIRVDDQISTYALDGAGERVHARRRVDPEARLAALLRCRLVSRANSRKCPFASFKPRCRSRSRRGGLTHSSAMATALAALGSTIGGFRHCPVSLEPGAQQPPRHLQLAHCFAQR